VEGRPICRPEQIPSLVGHDGSFPSKFDFFRRQLSGRLRADELHRELVAQINRVRDEGILPTHIDSHQHVHAHPAIFPVVARAAESCGIRAIRLPCERFSWRDGLRFPKGFLRARLISAAAGLCRRALSKTSLVSAETFGGTLCTGAVRADWLVDWFRRLKSGTAELMTHPGKCDDDLRRTGTRLLASRESELEALVDSRVRVAADELGIRLVHYGELVNRLNAAVGAEPARSQAG
jgi:predicted glycoside hydrolase/deacetylase ChbG (UPF0249 family)